VLCISGWKPNGNSSERPAPVAARKVVNKRNSDHYDRFVAALHSENMETPETFGPPIVPSSIDEPEQRPLAVALVFDISRSAYGNQRVVDLFKSALVKKFANMEYDNVLLLGNELHEDPGHAVAAIREYKNPVRRFNQMLGEAVRSLMHIDRFYVRRLVVVTDQFAQPDLTIVESAINKNQTSMSDIDFYCLAFGPQYERAVANCSWDIFRHAEPQDIEAAVNEVCS
jgi:hypothetical protein